MRVELKTAINYPVVSVWGMLERTVRFQASKGILKLSIGHGAKSKNDCPEGET